MIDTDDNPTLTLTVTSDQDGQRLDRCLADNLTQFSRTRLKALIDEGAVRINGNAPQKARETVMSGDIITLIEPPPRPAKPMPQPINFTIVYEDHGLLVVDKPSGLVCHPSPGHYDKTLVNGLLYHCGDQLSGIGGEIRPGLVHRLDKDTSGLLVVAKTDKVHRELSAQFMAHGRDGCLERAYTAFCWGALHPSAGIIKGWLDRDKRDRQKRAISQAGRGRFAETHYQTMRHYDAPHYASNLKKTLVSEIQCTLMTGRTHQIRVHLASKGAPLLGDMTYGAHFASKARMLTQSQKHGLEAIGSRQALHAAKLGFIHPLTDEKMMFTSDLPPDLKCLKQALAV